PRERNALVPRQALVDPGAQQADLFAGQFGSLLGHHIVRVHAGYQFDQVALLALAGHHRRTGPAALEQRLARVQTKLSLTASAAVTLNATGLKDGLNIRAEADGALGRRWQGLDLFRGQLGPGDLAQAKEQARSDLNKTALHGSGIETQGRRKTKSQKTL